VKGETPAAIIRKSFYPDAAAYEAAVAQAVQGVSHGGRRVRVAADAWETRVYLDRGKP
jgi:hypothetical protein